MSGWTKNRDAYVLRCTARMQVLKFTNSHIDLTIINSPAIIDSETKVASEKRFCCIECWSPNLTTDGKVTVAKGRKVTRYRCRDCGHRSFRRVDSYRDPRVLGNILAFYKEGFALDEPYLSLARALDIECNKRKGRAKTEKEWTAIINKVLNEQKLADGTQG